MVRDKVEMNRQDREKKNKSIWNNVEEWKKNGEKGQNLVDDLELANPDYASLHDIARHAIHVYETMGVSVLTVECVQQHPKEFYDYRNSDYHDHDHDDGSKNAEKGGRSSKKTATTS
ncbi:hypothetical protein C2857_006806 [Epichloe festucae Fl1]|uniref:Uncharacterized protein n=1 Tax=Epichloe festucae (strain Fl1) TaxID=877507 RepID=A0A7S9KLV6_EPIFF|nr:hypothetical protein C2857_006806 [Epichloe festucae Fl1]